MWRAADIPHRSVDIFRMRGCRRRGAITRLRRCAIRDQISEQTRRRAMKTILQNHVPYNTGWSAEMKQGQIIRITATTTVDFVFFKLQSLIERFDQPRTKVYNMKLFISTG